MEKDGNTHNCQARETRIPAYGVSVDVSASPWAREMASIHSRSGSQDCLVVT
jgi:hypothetical protein